MINLFDSMISDFLPLTPANEAHVKSIAYAVHCQLQQIKLFSMQMQVMCMLDNVPENVLDMLAVEFKTQYYSSDLEVERKRELVKNTFIWYMTAGTRSSLSEAVTSVFSDAEIHEWKETGDDPFTFTVETTAQIQEDKYKAFDLLIETMKNARSLFKKLRVQREVDFNLYQGIAISEFITNVFFVPTQEPELIVITDEDGKGLLDEKSKILTEEVGSI